MNARHFIQTRRDRKIPGARGRRKCSKASGCCQPRKRSIDKKNHEIWQQELPQFSCGVSLAGNNRSPMKLFALSAAIVSAVIGLSSRAQAPEQREGYADLRGVRLWY